MDRGAWWATVYRDAESDTTERLMLSLLVSAAPLSSVLCPTSCPSEAGEGWSGGLGRAASGQRCWLALAPCLQGSVGTPTAQPPF